MSVSFNQKTFTKDAQPFFLNSGEIQYFRIPRKYWEMHLQKAKDAGLNAVCTYIPWDWHEEEEGQFDFSGQTHPQKNLEAWLDLCQQYGLMAIVKPGPVILAEYRGAGIPFWFIDKLGQECRVKNSRGEIAQSDCMTFMHPTYLGYVRKWYDAVIPVLEKRQMKNDGPVIMMQVCNEVGVFTWLAHQADYSPYCLERYAQFLQDKYDDIQALNAVYATSYTSFAEVQPPSDTTTTYESREEWAHDIDWHQFWRWYYGDYLRLLMSELCDRGMSVPFYHNLPGWIYGSGWEFPLNITMYSNLYDQSYPDMIFGVDHIPEYLSYRNAHDDRGINDITLAMQGGGPLFAAEFQAGSREYHVVTTPREMQLFYKASLAHGLKGWNYYMFSQGKNPQGKGFSGSSFYWFTPLNFKGEESSLYPVIQETSALVQSMEQEIITSDRKSEIAVLFYEPYYATELEKQANLAACEMHLQPSQHRRRAYFDGVLKALHLLNIEYNVVDIQRCSDEDLKRYKQVWMFSTEICDADSQSKVVCYMEQGGQTVIYPTVPSLGLDIKPCTILQEALNVTDNKVIEVDSPLVELLGRVDVKCLNPLRVFDTSLESIAQVDGQSVGFKASVGQGQAVVLGFSLSFETEEHRWIYEDLCKLSDARLRWVDTSSERTLVHQRFSEDGALLFVGNYYNEEDVTSVTYTHPLSQKPVSWPLALDKVTLPQTYGVVTAIHQRLAEDLYILHSTSDLLGVERKDDQLVLMLKGDRDLKGEIVFEGVAVASLQKVTLGQKEVALQEKDAYYYVHYDHPHGELLSLTLSLSLTSKV